MKQALAGKADAVAKRREALAAQLDEAALLAAVLEDAQLQARGHGRWRHSRPLYSPYAGLRTKQTGGRGRNSYGPRPPQEDVRRADALVLEMNAWDEKWLAAHEPPPRTGSVPVGGPRAGDLPSAVL